MPDPSAIDHLLEPTVLSKTLSDEFEHKVVDFLLTACAIDENRETLDYFEWKQCNWGHIDREIGLWWWHRNYRAKWTFLKRLFGYGHTNPSDRIMKRHLLFFPRTWAERCIKRAIGGLARKNYVRSETTEHETHGWITLYSLTPFFFDALETNADR